MGLNTTPIVSPQAETLTSPSTAINANATTVTLMNNDDCGLTITPNPVVDIMKVHASKSVKDILIKIYAEHGKLVQTIQVATLNQNETTSVDVKSLPMGYYIVEFVINQKTSCKTRIQINQSTN